MLAILRNHVWRIYRYWAESKPDPLKGNDANADLDMDPLRGHDGPVNSVIFSPDGQTLASAGSDGNIRLWDPELGQWRGTLTGHTGPVRSLAFQRDGTMLASAGVDETIRLWYAPPVGP